MQQLSPESVITICPYSDCLLFSLKNEIHRVTSEGQSSKLTCDSQIENKEFVTSFSITDTQMCYLMKEKQTTPTVIAG